MRSLGDFHRTALGFRSNIFGPVGLNVWLFTFHHREVWKFQIVFQP